VGWAVGWKKSTNSETTPHSFPRTSFWIVSELPIIRELLHFNGHKRVYREQSANPEALLSICPSLVPNKELALDAGLRANGASDRIQMVVE